MVGALSAANRSTWTTPAVTDHHVLVGAACVVNVAEHRRITIPMISPDIAAHDGDVLGWLLETSPWLAQSTTEEEP